MAEPQTLDPDKYPYYCALRWDTDGRRYWRVVENSRDGAKELKYLLPRYYHHQDAEVVVAELTKAYERGKKSIVSRDPETNASALRVRDVLDRYSREGQEFALPVSEMDEFMEDVRRLVFEKGQNSG